MKILYVCLQLSYRGTEVATYNLAQATQVFTGIEPIICGTLARPHPALEKFQKQFKTITFGEDWKGVGQNEPFRNRLEQIVEEEKIDWCYRQINGFKEDSLPRNCKNFVHYVFQGDQEYGDKYIAISKYLANKFGREDYLNYIVMPRPVKAPPYICRDFLGLPREALVLGWTGGSTSFSIPWVTNSLLDLLSRRQDLWFVFLGLTLPFQHERIIQLPVTTDEERKWAMISACDAMLHSRRDGETFGMSCGEFSAANKPVITYDGYGKEYDRAHLDLLGDKAILYQDQNELKDIILGLNRKWIEDKDWAAYKNCSAMEVTKKFEEYLM